MKNLKSYIFLAIFFLFTSFKSLDSQEFNFDFLIGKWEAKIGSGSYYESWIKSNNEYIGKACFVSNQDTIEKENLKIAKVADYWVYIAQVNQSHPVLFTLVNIDTTSYRFENLEHDFPQTITYKIVDSNNIIALTEGIEKGKSKKFEFKLYKN